MNEQMDVKHTAEMGDVLKGRVRVAIPLSVILCILLLGPLAAVTGFFWSTSRANAYGAPSKPEGVGFTPVVHHRIPQQRMRRPITAEAAAKGKTLPCQNEPVFGDARSASGQADK
jgi:hypothetical protein